MKFHDLGPLWVESAGLPLSLNGRRMETAVSALLIRAGEPARTDWLIDCIWGPDPPPKASAALDTLIWRLRRTLDPNRPARAPSAVLRTDEQGYRLTVPSAAVDSRQFTAAADAVLANELVEPAALLDTTATALALWRGRPYDGIVDDGWLEPTRTRLTEQRLILRRAHVGALLARGAPEQAASACAIALTDDPYDELLWHQRILGLYRSGRPTSALDAYREARGLLTTELGVEPGPDLRHLHERVLRHDPTLLVPDRGRRPAPQNVRSRRRGGLLVGRDGDLNRAAESLRDRTVVTITGPVGCGKTALAVEVATRIAGRFPDGVVFVDLSDVTHGALVAERVREAMGLNPDPGASAAQAIVQYSRSRSMLLVLDNCEQIVDPVGSLVERMVGAGEGLRVLVTSRQPLTVAAEYVQLLPPLPLPSGPGRSALEASPAVVLFLARLEDDIDLDGEDGKHVAHICAATDGLPLALELAAARARIFQLHEVAASLSVDPITLGPSPRLGARSGERSTLRDAIEASHRLMSADERAAHRRFAVLPSGFTLSAAVAVCDGALADAKVIGVMTTLAQHCMLQSTGIARPAGPTLFRQLVPIRAHAAEQLQRAGDRPAGQAGITRWLSQVVSGGVRMGHAGQAGWYQTLDDNYRTVVATLESGLADQPDDQVLLAAACLDAFWIDRMHQADGRRLLSEAVRALGPHHGPVATIATRAAHASLLAVNQETEAAWPAARRALDGLPAVAAEDRLQAADRLLMTAVCAWIGDDPALVDTVVGRVAELAEELAEPHLLLGVRAVRNLNRLWTDASAAADRAAEILSDSEDTGNAFLSLVACATLSIAALFEGDGAAGLAWTGRVLALYDELGIRSIADTLETRGNHYVNADRLPEAVRCYGAAHFQNVRQGRRWPRHPGTGELMTRARTGLSATEFEHAWASGTRLGGTDLVRQWL